MGFSGIYRCLVGRQGVFGEKLKSMFVLINFMSLSGHSELLKVESKDLTPNMPWSWHRGVSKMQLPWLLFFEVVWI